MEDHYGSVYGDLVATQVWDLVKTTPKNKNTTDIFNKNNHRNIISNIIMNENVL